jgi:hypothetical protein
VGRIPHVAATIVPFDTTLPHTVVERIEARQQEAVTLPALATTVTADVAEHMPARPDGTMPICAVRWKQRVSVEGRVKLVQAGTTAGKSLEVQLFDDTGGMRLLFYGRTRIPGLAPGSLVRAEGRVGEYKGHLALANPRYELVPSRDRRNG